jgi:hypothetical protein
MSDLIELKLRGPHRFALDPKAGDSLFAAAEAWQPGIYLWTYFYNQSDRITHVGAADASIVQAHAAHLGAYLRGEYPVHDRTARAGGVLERVYSRSAGLTGLGQHREALLAELADLRIFFAALPGDSALRARVASAIAGHLQRLGGKALAWLNDGLARPAVPVGNPPVTVRFYRPVHMASMPEELVI